MALNPTKQALPKKAQYYPHLKRLSYWVTNQAKQTVYDVSEAQARMFLKDAATGHHEIVQVLEILLNTQI